MYIVKNGKEFTVEERKNRWNVFRIEDTSGVCLKIYKTTCPTIRDVVKRVRESDFFWCKKSHECTHDDKKILILSAFD